MMITSIIVFLLINSFSSLNNECDICHLNGFFLPKNGYECFLTNNNRTQCTCPDQKSTINRPCRICERPNICGTSSASCSEESSSFELTNKSSYFACFCSSNLFQIGKPCQEEILPTTLSTISTEETTPIQISTQETTNIQTSSIPSIDETNLIENSTVGTLLSSIDETHDSTEEPDSVSLSSTLLPIVTETVIPVSIVTSSLPKTISLEMNTTSRETTTTKCRNKSIRNDILVEYYLLVLFNLIYFVNK